MNNLSWLIYLAEVSSSLSIVFGFAAIILGIAVVFRVSGCWLECEEVPKSISVVLPIIIFVLASISAFLPSKNTVYAIAASEVGEELVKTPTAGKAVKALNAWLDRQITDDGAQPKSE